ncbi:non-homologous end-joining DNA ligase [Actinomycetospora chiangmaiensis]|uniref:non-homologous end-joining DNA ligase n=1 Tax=Actinomycetospora chiangmaiensis TaxID=402650 RepID=UPI0012FB5F68|nr:non-homologous end-joining DNA ligase [Actinomycetospora chiangmaiensis]
MGELRTYRDKRDPGRTPEPFGEVGSADTDAGGRFVIQEHHARRLHYDVRLERGGVLVCWAVPKGLPDGPGAPRLAVHTEDHPLEYLDFHGEIPAGEYGGGSMTIWDRGTYETEKWTDDEVAVRLRGERADGRFVFFRPKRNADGRQVQRSGARPSDEDWLVTRKGEEKARPPRDVQSPRVSVGGRALKLSNLDKELYPGTPKNAVVDYYARVADTLLPHLAGRPLTLRRFPDGIDGESFYEKNAGRNAPDWLRTVVVPTPGSSRGSDSARFVVVEELATLVYLANLAVLELHVPQWRVDPDDVPQPPDELVFDLDPGPGTGLPECARVACRVRDRLHDDGLVPVVKTSGSKGMQMTAPVVVADPGRTSEYARAIAQELARETPDDVTAVMAKDRRGGRVFIDWSQNNTAKTTVAPYSLRARAAHGVPTVSTPLTWDEVEAADDADALVFSPAAVLDRIAEHGDLYAGALTDGVELPD